MKKKEKIVIREEPAEEENDGVNGEAAAPADGNEDDNMAGRQHDDPQRDDFSGDAALPLTSIPSEESLLNDEDEDEEEEAKSSPETKKAASRKPSGNTPKMPRKIKSDIICALKNHKTYAEDNDGRGKAYSNPEKAKSVTHSLAAAAAAANSNRSVRFDETAMSSHRKQRQQQQASPIPQLPQPSSQRKHRMRRLDDDDDSDNDNRNAESDIGLLRLVAQRSHGIYTDGSNWTDDNDSNNNNTNDTETENTVDHEGSLLSKDSLRDSKLRHFDMGPMATSSAAAATSLGSRANNENVDRDITERKAGIGMFQSNGSVIPPPPPRGLCASEHSPGAYQGAPGRGFTRTEDFHGVLLQPDPEMAGYSSSLLGSGTHSFSPDNDINSDTQQPSLEEGQQPPIPLLDYTASGEVISAVPVNEESLELYIRDEITNNAVQAELFDLEKETETMVETKLHRQRSKFIVSLVLIVTGCIVGALVIWIIKKEEPTGSLSTPPDVTLRTIRERGTLRCAITTPATDRNYWNISGLVNFHSAFCEAIAAASLMGKANVSFQYVNERERWVGIEDGSYDVLITGTPAMTESFDWSINANIPVAFSPPFLFDGVGVGGIPEYIRSCANGTDFENFNGVCKNLKVCVAHGSIAYEIAQQRLHPNQIVQVATLGDVYKQFGSGCCNVIATDYAAERAEQWVRGVGDFNGSYLLGSMLFSRQPHSIATKKALNSDGNLEELAKDDDPLVFTDFVAWVVQAIIAAEEKNITQATAGEFPQTDVFGEQYNDMFRHAIAAVGNYGEVYERHRASIIPREGINLINDGTTGLHFHQSLGDVTEYGPDPYENMTLSRILKRRKLLCGIPVGMNSDSTAAIFGESNLSSPSQLTFPSASPELASALQGTLGGPTNLEKLLGGTNIDMEYCRALASSIFEGKHYMHDSQLCSLDTHSENYSENITNPTLEYVLLWNLTDGFAKLLMGEVDAVAGYRMDLQSDVDESTTGEGYSFSQPYFYGPTTNDQLVSENNRCVATVQKDQQWSSFVQLVVSSLFYAEEQGITQTTANEMPVVNMFGNTFKRMFRDAIFAVGNYGEMYDRSMEEDFSRSATPNMLNSDSDPQLAAMPGLWGTPAIAN